MGNGGRFSTNPTYHFKHIFRIANFLPSYLGSKQHANRRRQCYRIIGSKFSSVKKPSKLRLGLNLGFKFLDLILLSFSSKINKISTCYKFELSVLNMWISVVVFFFSLWHVTSPLLAFIFLYFFKNSQIINFFKMLFLHYFFLSFKSPLS